MKKFLIILVLVLTPFAAIADEGICVTSGDTAIVKEVLDLECKKFDHGSFCQVKGYRKTFNEFPYAVLLVEPTVVDLFWKVKVVGTITTAWGDPEQFFDAYVYVPDLRFLPACIVGIAS
jgi:hypothetical protein